MYTTAFRECSGVKSSHSKGFQGLTYIKFLSVEESGQTKFGGNIPLSCNVILAGEETDTEKLVSRVAVGEVKTNSTKKVTHLLFF